MPATLTSIREQLHEAVFNARVARHHPECACGQYRDAKGTPYCNATDWRYSSMTDRLIDKAIKENACSSPSAS